jgi:hypothetical protein
MKAPGSYLTNNQYPATNVIPITKHRTNKSKHAINL